MALLYPQQVEEMAYEPMQEVHEREIEILNAIDKLAIAVERKRGDVAELEAKLEEYIAHVKEHFANEERLMQTYGFPEYEMHKMAHDMFLADLEHSYNQWKNFGNIDKLIRFIRNSPEWLVMHINTVDTPTAQFLAYKTKQEDESKR